MHKSQLILLCLCLSFCASAVAGTPPIQSPGASGDPNEIIEVPVIDGEWWNISPQRPDVGPWSNDKGDACDFTIFQAGDGTWQLIGCRRGCAWPTGERVFYRAEGKKLTDRNWDQKGLFRTPDEKIEQVFSIQAPHCVKENEKWYLYYNAATGFGKTKKRTGNAAYVMVSDDGKRFTDLKSPTGDWFWFKMGRDIQLFKDDASGKWLAFFQDSDPKHASEFPHGRFFFRTGDSLTGPWSEDKKPLQISGNPESPFMLKRGARYYFWQQMYVYESTTPTSFPDPPITKLTPGGRVHGKYAPEIIQDNGQDYLAGYGAGGIWVTKLKWEKRSRQELRNWWDDFNKRYPDNK